MNFNVKLDDKKLQVSVESTNLKDILIYCLLRQQLLHHLRKPHGPQPSPRSRDPSGRDGSLRRDPAAGAWASGGGAAPAGAGRRQREL